MDAILMQYYNCSCYVNEICSHTRIFSLVIFKIDDPTFRM